jgi:hypothetical protein
MLHTAVCGIPGLHCLGFLICNGITCGRDHSRFSGGLALFDASLFISHHILLRFAQGASDAVYAAASMCTRGHRT